MDKALTLLHVIEACAKHGATYAPLRSIAEAQLKDIQNQFLADQKAAETQVEIDKIIAATPAMEADVTPISKRKL